MTLHLRGATMEDARRLLEWRNDPATRANSFSQDEVPWDGHVAWLERMLAAPGTRIWVGEVDGVPVGQVRYDQLEDEPWSAEVSIVVAPTVRGRGVGTALLVTSSEMACRELGVARLVGRIKRENEASVRAFARAGYRVAAEEMSVDGELCVVVELVAGGADSSLRSE